MENHKFTIIVSGLDPEADDFEDRFFQAGCDDALLGIQRGLITLYFTRRAASRETAIESAIRDVNSTGAKVERVTA